jgi:hypothetical protein
MQLLKMRKEKQSGLISPDFYFIDIFPQMPKSLQQKHLCHWGW